MPHWNGSWMDRVSRAIPGLNERILDLDDLYRQCEKQEYFALESPLRRLHGCSFLNTLGQPSMVINSLLRSPEKIVAGWHEYIHLLLHSPMDNEFCSTGNLWRHTKTERQAQIVGVIALLPTKLLTEDLSEYPARIVKYRRGVWDEFGL